MSRSRAVERSAHDRDGSPARRDTRVTTCPLRSKRVEARGGPSGGRKGHGPSGHVSGGRVGGAAAAMLAIVFLGHRASSPPDHTLAPDLLYGVMVLLLVLAACVVWVLTRRSRGRREP